MDAKTAPQGVTIAREFTAMVSGTAITIGTLALSYDRLGLQRAVAGRP